VFVPFFTTTALRQQTAVERSPSPSPQAPPEWDIVTTALSALCHDSVRARFAPAPVWRSIRTAGFLTKGLGQRQAGPRRRWRPLAHREGWQRTDPRSWNVVGAWLALAPIGRFPRRECLRPRRTPRSSSHVLVTSPIVRVHCSASGTPGPGNWRWMRYLVSVQPAGRLTWMLREQVTERLEEARDSSPLAHDPGSTASLAR